jgi:hypothetical protein
MLPPLNIKFNIGTRNAAVLPEPLFKKKEKKVRISIQIDQTIKRNDDLKLLAISEIFRSSDLKVFVI